MNREPSNAALGWLAAAGILVALSGCHTYTATLRLDPENGGSRRLGEAQRDRADALVERVVAAHGFIRDPNQVRLQRRSRNSVQSAYSVISSYVPRHAVSGNRLTIATVIEYSDGGFAVLIRDRSAREATPLVAAVMADLRAAFDAGHPGQAIRVEQTRWGPPGGR